MIVFRRFYRGGVPGPALLVLEGAVVTAMGVLCAWWLFPDEASLICLFLASISAGDSVERILGWNRRAIIEQGLRPLHANVRLIGLFLSIFAGSFIAFGAIGLTLPITTLQHMFGHQMGPGVRALFPAMGFGSFVDLFRHNLYVVFFFFLIALPFRQGGVMLAITWNASVWGITFAGLARRWSGTGGPPLGEASLRVMAACMPHMAIEGLAFVTAGLAGVFLSRGIERYEIASPITTSILKSSAGMLVGAVILVVLGAAWEAHVARWLVVAFS